MQSVVAETTVEHEGRTVGALQVLSTGLYAVRAVSYTLRADEQPWPQAPIYASREFGTYDSDDAVPAAEAWLRGRAA